jgi:FkbM family methyltransferase
MPRSTRPFCTGGSLRPVERRCGLLVLPAAAGEPDRAAASVMRARSVGAGDFAEVVRVDPPGDKREKLAAAARQARSDGIGWLLILGGGETLVPDAFQKLAPALRLHDAVWGAAGVSRPDGTAPIEPITRLAAQDEAAFHHCALRWWIGESHFVRPAAALAALEEAHGPAWHADYLRALWREGRAYKTAQTVTIFSAKVPPVPDAIRARLLERLERDPVFTAVSHGGASFRLPYTGRNAGIERAHTRGQFYEHEELAYLAARFPPGMKIVDAGANTGNHTVFFAGAMHAETVRPIEPDPRAAAALRCAVSANGLANVELAGLGTAVGAAPGRMRRVASEAGGLGATRLVPDAAGEVPVVPLDELVGGPVDLLKIDVEGMEMEVLAGAAALVARERPALFVEVADGTTAAFLAWTDCHAYRIEKLFPDKGHCNFVLVPNAR